MGASLKSQPRHSNHHHHSSDVEYTNSSASITRSGSFISATSPHAPPQHQPSSKQVPRGAARNNARDLGLGVNSDDDSMHEKYFKSVDSTPQASRRRTTTATGAATGAVCPAKHSSDSSPQSPHGVVGAGGGAVGKSASGRISGNSNNNNNNNISLDNTTSTNRSSRSNPSRDPLLEKPEKYLDKMLFNPQSTGQREKGNHSSSSSHHQMKLPLNVESQFVSKTATITSQSNLSGGNASRAGTNSRISPKAATAASSQVSPGSQELLLSKTNLERHNRDLAQSETQMKLKKRSPANTGVRGKQQQLPPSSNARPQQPGRTNTYASDVDYDAGNMSPLYSNWDQQEHLLPLQHYIIEQAKLSSKYNKYFADDEKDDGEGDDEGEEGGMDSDSLHSDSQSEHSLSGHEPDNEDSDHSESRGDYLTYQHFMPADMEQDRQNYYNVFDKSNGREDL